MKVSVLMICILVAIGSSRAIEPADPDLIPEGRALLNYLESIYKTKTLMAINGEANRRELVACLGKDAAILSADMTGWNSPKYAEGYAGSYSSVISSSLKSLQDHYKRGGILEVHFHWPNPLTGLAGFDASKDNLTDQQWSNIITPGTEEYNTMIADLDWHIDRMLKPLADDNIPVLWRPLHEINGGWFWWTCDSDPAKTAELWRIIFNHMVKDRGLHNLIWVYNDAKYDDNLQWRVPYKPGSQYYDLAAIDLYLFDARETGIHHAWNKDITYRNVFDMMEQLHPGKMIALGEVHEIPNMEKTANNDPAFAPWLYALPWWFEDNGDANCPNKPCNPCTWAAQTYPHEFAITLDEINIPSEDQVLARITTDKKSGFAPLAVSFDASGSVGNSLVYSWNFGDGAVVSGQKVIHTFENSGTFTVVLAVSGGNVIDRDTVEVTVNDINSLPDQITVDDSQTGSGLNLLNFSTGWNTSTTAGAYMSGEHYSSQQGASYTIEFYGSQFTLYATKDAHHGIAAMNIDGGASVEVDFYSPDRQEQVLVYTSPVLSQGMHTLKVEVSGTKNNLSSGFVVVADRLEIFLDPLTTDALKRQPSLRSSAVAVHEIYNLSGKLVGRTARSVSRDLKSLKLPAGSYIVRTRLVDGTQALKSTIMVIGR